MPKQRLILTVGAWLFLALAITLPWIPRWYTWRSLPTLSRTPLEDAAASSVDGIAQRFGDLELVLPSGSHLKMSEASKVPIWELQLGDHHFKLSTPTVHRESRSSRGLCCHDPWNTPYEEQVKQLYTVSSGEFSWWMSQKDFRDFSNRIRCAFLVRVGSPLRILTVAHTDSHISIIEMQKAAEVTVVDDKSQKVWGFLLASIDQKAVQEDLIDFASRIRIPRD